MAILSTFNNDSDVYSSAEKKRVHRHVSTATTLTRTRQKCFALQIFPASFFLSTGLKKRPRQQGQSYSNFLLHHMHEQNEILHTNVELSREKHALYNTNSTKNTAQQYCPFRDGLETSYLTTGTLTYVASFQQA
jgi:hypothetical protein